MVEIEEVACAPSRGDVYAQLRACEQRIEEVQEEIKALESALKHRVLRQEERSSKTSTARAPPLQKRYSTRSRLALDDLDHIGSRLDALEEAAKAALAEVAAAVAQEQPIDPAVRDTLAQVYGDTTRLVSSGGALLSVADDVPTQPLDGISTTELDSGKGDARTARKAHVNRAEALAERVRAAIALIDKRRA